MSKKYSITNIIDATNNVPNIYFLKSIGKSSATLPV